MNADKRRLKKGFIRSVFKIFLSVYICVHLRLIDCFSLINVALVTLGFLEVFNVFLGLLSGFAAVG